MVSTKFCFSYYPRRVSVMKRKAKSAAIYCRISQDPTGERLGVQRQEELCRSLADSLGWDVAEVYVDNDISAYRAKPRPAFQRMLKDLEAGVRDGVVVVDQDRLVRHIRQLEDFIDLADRHGIVLANVSGDLDLSTSDGRLTARIRGSVARHESEKKSERLKRQRAQAARQGKRHGGRRPFGYHHDGVTVREEEASIVREMAKRFIAGETLPSLAGDLNERGIPTARARTLLDRAANHDSEGRTAEAERLRAEAADRAWMTSSLRSILANARIAGLRVHRGEVVAEAEWPPLIDRETHEQIRAKLGDPRRTQRGRPPAALLTGIARCGRCGGPMYASRSRTRTSRYVCDAGPGRDGCGRIAIVLERIDDIVRDAVLTALSSPDLGQAVSAARSDAEEVKDLGAQIARDEDELETLARQMAEGDITRREWLAAREVYVERIEQARQELTADEHRSVLEGLPTSPSDLSGLWDRQPTDWRRALLKAVVEQVTVNPADTPGRFDPDRIKFVWRA